MRISATTTPAILIQTEGDEDSLSEIFQAIFSVTGRYRRLPKVEIARIYENRFQSENLYKFCHLKGRKDKKVDKNITLKSDEMKIKKVTSKLRDFWNIIDIWSDRFLNYSMVMVDLFVVAFPSLFRSLLMFHLRICHLSQIYDWQHSVFPLAIDNHIKMSLITYTNVGGWVLSQQWADQCCLPLWVLQNSISGS